MQTTTIQKLNQLNKQFYLDVAEDFTQTRNSFWQGWTNLIPHISASANNSLSVLDVGCGNARFGQFLNQQFPDLIIQYTGLDNSVDLLKYAKEKLQSTKLQSKLFELDLIKQLLLKKNLVKNRLFDVVVAFGVFHHIPSFDLRNKLFQQLSTLVAQNGILSISFWQFLNSVKLRERIIDPKTLDLDVTEFEENDYILDWRAGKQLANRYCHYTNNEEEIALLKQTKLKVIDEFFADGVTNNLNHYLVLKKL